MNTPNANNPQLLYQVEYKHGDQYCDVDSLHKMFKETEPEVMKDDYIKSIRLVDDSAFSMNFENTCQLAGLIEILSSTLDGIESPVKVANKIRAGIKHDEIGMTTSGLDAYRASIYNTSHLVEVIKMVLDKISDGLEDAMNLVNNAEESYKSNGGN